MKTLWLIPVFVSLVLVANADSKTYKDFGAYRVYYSAFNSSFINPDIATIYKITRGKNKGLVNIALVKDNNLSGSPALVGGTVANIFAQQQRLDFVEVREGDAVYYLAPFRFENEDALTFKIQVKPYPNQPAYTLSFQRTLYFEE